MGNRVARLEICEICARFMRNLLWLGQQVLHCQGVLVKFGKEIC